MYLRNTNYKLTTTQADLGKETKRKDISCLYQKEGDGVAIAISPNVYIYSMPLKQDRVTAFQQRRR